MLHVGLPSKGPLSRLAHLLSKKPKGFSRRHERYPCFVPGVMEVNEIEASFEGAILELSAGGCSFRPASMFLLDREGEMVSVRTPAFEVRGKIRATRPDSYGIQFLSELELEQVDDALRLNLDQR